MYDEQYPDWGVFGEWYISGVGVYGGQYLYGSVCMW